MVWLHPGKECAWSGCRRTVKHPERYCWQHKKQGEARDKPFKNAKRHDPGHYNKAQWGAIRKAKIARNPICENCNVRPSSHVDHIVRRADGGTDDDDNLQALCHVCHSTKTGGGR